MAKKSANTKNESKNRVKNQGKGVKLPRLAYATYTSERTGKTCPVITGIMGKKECEAAGITTDPRMEAIEAARGTLSSLVIEGERMTCAIFGTAYHDIAKRLVSALNAGRKTTAIATDAAAIYAQRKAEGQARDKERKAEKSEAKKGTAKAKPEAKKGASKAAPVKGKGASKPTAKPEATAELYTRKQLEGALRGAFAALAKQLGTPASAFEGLIEAAVKAA